MLSFNLQTQRNVKHNTVSKQFCYLLTKYNFVPSKGVKYCNQYACMSVCPLAYLKNQTSKFHQIFLMLYVALARSSSDNNAVCYVLSVLWMICFHIRNQIQTQAGRLQCWELFTVTRQVAPLNCTLSELYYRWPPCVCMVPVATLVLLHRCATGLKQNLSIGLDFYHLLLRKDKYTAIQRSTITNEA